MLGRRIAWQGTSQAALVSQIKQVLPHLAPDDGYLSAETWTATLPWMLAGGVALPGGINDPQWSYVRRVDMSFFENAIGRKK